MIGVIGKHHKCFQHYFPKGYIWKVLCSKGLIIFIHPFCLFLLQLYFPSSSSLPSKKFNHDPFCWHMSRWFIRWVYFYLCSFSNLMLFNKPFTFLFLPSHAKWHSHHWPYLFFFSCLWSFYIPIVFGEVNGYLSYSNLYLTLL
jgi:hypothetical protein